GRRFKALNALTDAANLARDLDLSADDILNHRNEAIACMALVDLRLDRKWDGYPSGSTHTGIAFDKTMQHYAPVDGNGHITVRRLADNGEVVTITDVGAPASPHRPPDWRMSLAFSPDGRFLAAIGDSRFGASTPMQVWDLTGPKMLLKATPGRNTFGPVLDFS